MGYHSIYPVRILKRLQIQRYPQCSTPGKGKPTATTKNIWKLVCKKKIDHINIKSTLV
jgi:hypothetical protein